MRSAILSWAGLTLTLGLLAGPILAHGSRSEGAPAPDAEVVRVKMDRAAAAKLEADHDVWHYDLATSEAIVLLRPGQKADLEALGYAVRIDEEHTATLTAPEIRGQGGGIPGFSCYRTVEETFADLAQLAADNPGLARWIDIGDSWEKFSGSSPGFDIHAMVVGNRSRPGTKFPLMIIAAMHARELTTAETATRLAERLVEGYGVDADITWLLDHADVHIIPQLNPDGRKQAEGGAFWRKNTDNDFCSNSSSRGVDLNRNSSFFWGESASSGSSCSEVFRGPSAASEPETDAIEAYMGQIFQDQRGPGLNDAAPDDATGIFISLHSFGEIVFYPWEGRSTTPAPNIGALRSLARKFGFYTDYQVCQDCLGSASGTTVDAAYGEYGVAAFTYELGTTFFQNCSTYESSIVEDNLDSLIYAIKAARRPYLEPQGPEVVDVALSSPTVTAGETVTLTASADDGRFDSNGFGNETVQTVAAAYFTVDIAPWEASSLLPLGAADGAFDETEEGVEGVLDPQALGLEPGQHLIYVVAEDSDGQIGVPSAIFLEVQAETLIFQDFFESGGLGGWSSFESSP